MRPLSKDALIFTKASRTSWITRNHENKSVGCVDQQRCGMFFHFPWLVCLPHCGHHADKYEARSVQSNGADVALVDLYPCNMILLSPEWQSLDEHFYLHIIPPGRRSR